MLSDLRESGCLTGDSLVTLCNGQRVPIAELSGKAGFEVFSLNSKALKLEHSIVTNAFCTGKKQVFTLQTQLGRSIRATANHKFLTIEGWKRLDQIKIGERIALPRRVEVNANAKMSNDQLALLGHVIGDGCMLPGHAIQYTTRELDLAETVSKLASNVFGNDVRPRITKERSWYQVYLSSTRNHTHGVYSAIREWAEELGIWGLRSGEKFIPSVVFEQSAYSIQLFLRHLWSTDGCVRMTYGKSPRAAIYYASSSERLAMDVQTLLLRTGINARVTRHSQGEKGQDQYHVTVSGIPDCVSFCNRIGAVGAYKTKGINSVLTFLNGKLANTNRDVLPKDIWQLYVKPAMKENGVTHRELHDRIQTAYAGMTIFKQNVSRERAAKVAEAVGSAELHDLATSDVYWDQVASIDPDGTEPVYDLTVPGNHNFVANNIIVHNSIEQDADVVMFIYREDYYIEDTDRQNIADVIVAKHRHGSTGTVSLYFRKELTQFNDMEIHRTELDY
ncbi:MAG: DnaB-like helicase C-terminal domain-containing protein [Caldilineaceae bacterium]